MKIGVPEEFFGEGLDADCRKALEDAIETYKKLGAEIVPVSMPHMKYGIAAYYIIAPAEASSNLARYDASVLVCASTARISSTCTSRPVTEALATKLNAASSSGPTSSARAINDAYYLRAMKVRTLIKQDYDEALKKCDVLITPTAPDTAFKIGQNSEQSAWLCTSRRLHGYVEPGWPAGPQHSLRLQRRPAHRHAAHRQGPGRSHTASRGLYV